MRRRPISLLQMIGWRSSWIPACAGMTKERGTSCKTRGGKDGGNFAGPLWTESFVHDDVVADA